MAVQIGRKKQVPIYGTTTTTGPVLTTDTLSSYFTITQGSSYGWTYNIYSGPATGEIVLVPGNIGVNSSTSTITLKAVRDLPNNSIYYRYYTESNRDKITVSIGDEILLNAVSGVDGGPSNPTASGSSYSSPLVTDRPIYKGEEITLKYVKDSSVHHTYESYTEFTIMCDPYMETTTTITGYEEKLLPQTISNLYLSPTKKVIGGWIKNSSGAKLFYGGLAFKYTGNYTTSTITISGTNYDLYTLTSAGTLTLAKEAQVWACGGGGGGANGYKVDAVGYTGGGGGGGYVLEATTLQKGEYAVTIGAGGAASRSGGTTSIGSYSASGGKSRTASTNSNYGGDGGSGGGVGKYKTSQANVSTSNYYGKGAGVSTYPFGLTQLKAHSAGGGAGSQYGGKGGDGGTNGGNGLASNSNSGDNSTTLNIYYGGVGGEYGGGTGGNGYNSTAHATNGYAATFYGGGGGGAGLAGSASSGFTTYSGGSGYQGVVYVAIPK